MFEKVFIVFYSILKRVIKERFENVLYSVECGIVFREVVGGGGVVYKLLCIFGFSCVLKVEIMLLDFCVLVVLFLEFRRGFE